ncbi:TrkA C-terminal domain-containing protein [Halosimplex amylolyticum]|uniref:TrkA C-terminal domain-containing protein n=1 Tax=Halosimplex amylolyticum TaxID=3396616 RepID=UPI003F54E545
MSGRPLGLPLASAVEALAVETPAIVAQSRPLTDRVLIGAAQILGLSLIAAGVAAVVAILYRWYVRERVPGGLPTLLGLSAVVPLFGTQKLLQELIEPTASGDPLNAATALFNIAAFLVALAATRVGTDVGDRIGSDLTVATGERGVESEVGRVVQAVGRVITVELPEEVEDIVGYDPVPDETKDALAGKTFVFPRRLTVDELRGRLVTRLKADYAVGHVDVELADDGAVEYLAVGSRAAGIGPTLPPETSAVAVQADPAFAASAGDLVQVWGTDPFERVLTAEVRGTVDDVVTLAVDAADTRKLDAETRYRLVTLPVETRPDREFASVLRAADETMAAVTVADGSPLAGQPVGALDVTVVAIRPRAGTVEPLPARDRVLTAGDALYLVAAPEAIRKVEQGATPAVGGPAADSTAPSAGSGAQLAPDEQVDATTPVAGEDSEASGTTASPSGSTDETPRTDDSAGVDDLSDADAPGIQALETDEPGGAGDAERSTDSESVSAELAEDDSPDGEPTREDLNDLAGVDVDDLTGTDVTVDANGEHGDSPDEPTVEVEETDEATDSEETDEATDSDGTDDAVEPDDGGGPADETATDEPDDGDETGDDGDETDDDDGETRDDDDGTDDDDGDGSSDDTGDDGGWTVAVDERRDDDSDR